jgi:steroid 5-alpha reductase family enzyme
LIGLFVAVAAGLAVAMSGAWAVQRVTGNAGWVDVVWSAATGLAGVACALVVVPGESGIVARQWLVAALAAVWSARLAWHIAERTAGKPEDVRYAGFRREWGAAYQARMFWFLMIQAAAAALLAVSFLVAARRPGPLGVRDGLGVVVWLVAVGGESLADWQMRRYRRRAPHGGVCEDGLWGWSRHPNYFFEWLGWCAYGLIAIDPAWGPGWLALSGPAFMFWLLRYVSGVPPLEAAMLKSRGARFADYQARVSAFVPLPPRRLSQG